MTYTNITVLEYVANSAAYDDMTVAYDDVEVISIERMEGTDEFTLTGVDFFPQVQHCTVSADELLTIEPKVSEFDEALQAELKRLVSDYNESFEQMYAIKSSATAGYFSNARTVLCEFILTNADAIRFVREGGDDAHSV